jgi:hypothetical protein
LGHTSGLYSLEAFFVPILCHVFLSWRISFWLLFSVSIYNPRKQLINNTYFQKQFLLSKFCSEIGNCIINWQNCFKTYLNMTTVSLKRLSWVNILSLLCFALKKKGVCTQTF